MIHLADFTGDDIERLIAWVPTEEAMMQWTAAGFAWPLTRDPIAKHVRDGRARGDRRFLKAVERETGEMVGYLELGTLDRHSGSFRVSRVLVAPEARGQGVGGAMMRAVLEMAFGEMGAHRVELGVFHFNHAAIALYARAGFRREGVKRESFRGRDGWWSEVVMGILASEWDEIRSRP